MKIIDNLKYIKKIIDKMFKILKYSKFKESINEGVIVVKRKYTESYPTIIKNLNTKIRNYILLAIGDKILDSQELLNIISAAGSKNAKQWLKQNGEYFKLVKGNTNTETFQLTNKAFIILKNLENKK